MKKRVICLLGLIMAFAVTSRAEVTIIDDDFSSSPVQNTGNLLRGSSGWTVRTVSNWANTNDMLSVSGTAAVGEGACAQIIDLASLGLADENALELSFDYATTNEGETIYVHLWGYKENDILSTPSTIIANTGAQNGSAWEGTGAVFDDYNLGKADGIWGHVSKGIASDAALILTGSGTFSNIFNIATFSTAPNALAEYDYIAILFTRNQATTGWTTIDNVKLTAVSAAAPAGGVVQKNLIFPDVDVLASQQDANATSTIAYTGATNAAANVALGQSFSVPSAQTLRAITIQKSGDLAMSVVGMHELNLWVGEYDSTTDSSNHVVGATLHTQTIDITGVSFGDGEFYTFNLDSDLNLTAGVEYGFELAFNAADTANNFAINRYYDALIDPYADGTILYKQFPGALPFVSTLDQPTNDLVFALHSAPVAAYASATIDPEVIELQLITPATTATGTVDFAYFSDTNLNVTISVSDESHAGAFTVLSATPQIVTNSPTAMSVLFDNSVAGLSNGDSATGLVSFVWEELGSARTGLITLPISARAGYPPGVENLFTAGASMEWNSAANWDLARVPGVLAEDLAVIAGGMTANVSSDFTGEFVWETVVRGAATLNIGANLIGGGNLSVGLEGEDGFVNQTAGTNEVATLTIGDAMAAAASNVYTLSEGVLSTSGELVINSGGMMRITGGSMTTATGVVQTGRGVALNAGGVLEISGGTYFDTSRIWAEAGSIMRIIGDDADITVHQFFGRFLGTVEFVLGETGVSTLKNNSWGQLGTTTFNIDGAGYTGGPQDILLYSGNWNNVGLGANYTVSNLGVEGVDWQLNETTSTPHTVTLTILGPAYETWAYKYRLVGDDAAEDFDYDGDMLDNLYEYAVGGNPTNAADVGYASTSGIVDDGGTSYFEYVYARRLDPESGLVYSPMLSPSIAFPNWSSDDVVELPISGVIDADFESVTNRVDTTSKPAGFMKLFVDKPE